MYAAILGVGCRHSSERYSQLLPTVEELPTEDREWTFEVRLTDVTDGHSNPPALAREFSSRKPEGCR